MLILIKETLAGTINNAGVDKQKRKKLLLQSFTKSFGLDVPWYVMGQCFEPVGCEQ